MKNSAVMVPLIVRYSFSSCSDLTPAMLEPPVPPVPAMKNRPVSSELVCLIEHLVIRAAAVGVVSDVITGADPAFASVPPVNSVASRKWKNCSDGV